MNYNFKNNSSSSIDNDRLPQPEIPSSNPKNFLKQFPYISLREIFTIISTHKINSCNTYKAKKKLQKI